jgi:hypothetical protein
MNIVRMAIAAGALMACCGIATAKLPPPTPEEEAKAAEAKEKAKAAAAEAEAARMRVIDRIAANYIAEMAAKGITVQPTPVESKTDAAVTTAPGKTPAESDTGEAPERKGAPPSNEDATGSDTGKESNRK